MLERLFEKLKAFPERCVTEISASGQRRAMRFSELAERVDALSEALRARGLCPGQLVCLHAANSIDYAVWDLAAVRLGLRLLTPPEEQSTADVEALAQRFH